MELGVIRWFRVIPEFGGNQDLPPGEQISLEIERMRTAEIVQAGFDSATRNVEWRDALEMRTWSEHPEYGPIIMGMDPDALSVFRQFCEKTRNWKGCFFGGVESKDPAEIYLRGPIALTMEITRKINQAAYLSGHDLGNFVLRCGGSPSETPAPLAGEADEPTLAKIPPEGTES